MAIAELDRRLAEITQRRKEQLPQVDTHLEVLERVGQALEGIRGAANDLPESWKSDPDIRDALRRLSDSQLTTSLPSARALLEGVRGRFERETVNIGVSGRARVGKSAMLRTVSGLTDQQIPTGEGANVTAVRSRIFHASRSKAYLTFHDDQSFLAEIVWPYFDDLALPEKPRTLAEFARVDLTTSSSGSRELGIPPRQSADDATGTVERRDRLERLLEIQQALRGIRIDGSELVLDDLSDLRRYVAYPTTDDLEREDSAGAPAARDYLGVRDCRIETPFPVTAVERLGMVDLPGLGEVASGIDDRIMAGLREDVDAVLVVFRAAIGLTNIDQIDIRALDLIKEAQGAIADSRDFAWVVVNAGPEDGKRRQDLVSQIQRRLNHKEPNSRYLVVTADAMDQASMHGDVLVPILSRLAERLPSMDAEVLEHAVARTTPSLRDVRDATSALLDAIRSVQARHPSVRIQLDDLAQDLRRDIQQSLRAVKPYSLADPFVERYRVRLEGVHRSVREWLGDGLGTGVGRDEWIANADRDWGITQSHRPLANAELHRLRVAVMGDYAELDAFLNDVIVEEFYQQICNAVADTEDGSRSGARLAYLLGDRSRSARAQIATLVDRLTDCEPEVPGLAAAVKRLDHLQFDFRMQSYPLLLDLHVSRRPADAGDRNEGYPPDFGKRNTADMYDWFFDEFVQFSYQIQRALQNDSIRQFRVLTGAAMVFEDAVVRSGWSSREFRNLAEGFRDELWPGRFDNVNRSSARAQKLRRAAQGLLDVLNEATGVSNGQ